MTKRGSGLEQLSVYVTPEEKKIVDALAKADNRSISNLLKTLALMEAQTRGVNVDEEEVTETT